MASSRITGTNENISTYGTVARDYTVLATWEAATDVDLVTATTSEVLECYADAAAYDDSVTIAGATTSATYFRIIRSASGEGHAGTPGSGVIFSTTSAVDIFSLDEQYATLIDLVIIVQTNNAGSWGPVYVASGGNSTRILDCFVKSTNSGAGTATGIFTEQTGTVIIVNTAAYACKSHGFYHSGTGTTRYYNCAAVSNVASGFTLEATRPAVYMNCLAFGNVTGFTLSGTSTGSDFNASSDATAPGTTNYRSQSFTFVDAANNDWHLHRNDLGATFRGTSLAADATFPFDDDIDGNTITNWNIGFDSSSVAQSSWRTGDNENVSTYAASGADYTALTTWEAATDNDLVTGAVTEVLECEAAIYNDTVSLAGATTDGRYMRIIRPATGHEHGGLPGSGVEFVATSLTSLAVLHVAENFSKVQGVTVSTAVSSASTTFGILTTTDYNEIVGVIADTVTNAGAGGAVGIGHATGSDRVRVANCLALNCETTGFAANGTSVNIVWTNNTSVGSPTGFAKGAGASVIAINNLADSNATAGFSGTYATGTSFNASEKADAPGTNDRDSQTFTFVDELGENFHLDEADAGALGFGTDMSANNWFNYNDDVDLQEADDWSIGFDSYPEAEPEPPAGGTSFLIYFRRRRHR